ncbi:MAG: DUF3094 family protein [bacterium]
MPEREEELYSEEDLERVRQVTSSGYNAVERKPFRPLRLLLIWWVVVTILGLGAYGIGWFYGVI